MEEFKMKSTVECEWLESNLEKKGEPIGFRIYKTEIESIESMENFILKIEERIISKYAQKSGKCLKRWRSANQDELL